MDKALLLTKDDIRPVSVIPMEIEHRYEDHVITVHPNLSFEEVIPMGIIVGTRGKTAGQLNAELESNRITEEVQRGKYDGLSLTQAESDASWLAQIDASRRARSVENSLMEANLYDNPNESVSQTYHGVPLNEERIASNIKMDPPSQAENKSSGYETTQYNVTEYNVTEYKSIYGDT